MLILYDFIFYKNRVYYILFNNKKSNIALAIIKKIEINLSRTNHILLYNNNIILLVNYFKFYI